MYEKCFTDGFTLQSLLKTFFLFFGTQKGSILFFIEEFCFGTILHAFSLYLNRNLKYYAL